MKKIRPVIAVLSLGSELVDGSTVNTNASHIASVLVRHGFQVKRITTIPDEEDVIIQTLDEIFQDTDLVITTGGLGPTFDDITIPTLAKYFNRKLVFNQIAYKSIANYFKSRHKIVKKVHREQAVLPKGCYVVVNRVGVCPALYLHDKKRAVLSMPGVPSEMEGMFESSVVPFFKKKYLSDNHEELWIKTACTPEVIVEKKILPLVKRFQTKKVSFGIYPRASEVFFKVKVQELSRQKAKAKISQIRREIVKKVKDFYYGENEETLESVCAKLLIQKKKTIALAESCTGGWISKSLTDISGISNSLLAGFVVYSDKAKEKLIGVSKETLKKYGAVSREVAKELAQNVRKKFNTSFGVSVTGIAGPTGGTKKKPVGLVFIGIATRHKTEVFQFQFFGSRESIRAKTVKHVLFYLIKRMKK